MDQTRKMWASAAVVGVILVGGASVAAAASAGRLERVGKETRAVVEEEPFSRPSSSTQNSADEIPADRIAGLTAAPEPSDGTVVSKELNPDPEKVIEYWTDKRMEDAQPMPMPEVTLTTGE
ncbi:hypothetical protein [Nonomuraea sp. NEAU-A123]|uniref:hypothetical protein n=1 Tax=Nonomuraea sp. NEAU-A123 TaxID=2839649 RepID=UPI001BE493DB|nr:hypothetical protein [Nonomuraea sp. NEAU-A123]MBT2225465.1 hypothetical protein [Nonomuraea sp. NEAU-A123]